MTLKFSIERAQRTELRMLSRILTEAQLNVISVPSLVDVSVVEKEDLG